MNRLRIGFPISLSGKYSIQGTESLNGIKLWQKTVNSNSGIYVKQYGRKLPAELIYYDDQSNNEKCREVTLKLLTEDKPDLFLGPYSSGLAIAIAPITKTLDRIVWNYGGATDEITEKGYTNFINAITPSSHYYHGIIELFADKLKSGNKKLAIVFAYDSGFSSRVYEGAREYGLKHKFTVSDFGYKSGKDDFTDIVEKLITLKPDLILGVGRMHDDLNFAKSVIKSRNLLTNNIAVLAASIDHFKEVFGSDADGFLATSQWEKDSEIKPDFGPTTPEFYNHYVDTYNKEPGYLAAQAYNIGLIIEKCIEQSESIEEPDLANIAMDLDIKTFYGKFKLDKKTGEQIGHTMCVIRWTNGQKMKISN